MQVRVCSTPLTPAAVRGEDQRPAGCTLCLMLMPKPQICKPEAQACFCGSAAGWHAAQHSQFPCCAEACTDVGAQATARMQHLLACNAARPRRNSQAGTHPCKTGTHPRRNSLQTGTPPRRNSPQEQPGRHAPLQDSTRILAHLKFCIIITTHLRQSTPAIAHHHAARTRSNSMPGAHAQLDVPTRDIANGHTMHMSPLHPYTSSFPLLHVFHVPLSHPNTSSFPLPPLPTWALALQLFLVSRLPSLSCNAPAVLAKTHLQSPHCTSQAFRCPLQKKAVSQLAWATCCALCPSWHGPFAVPQMARWPDAVPQMARCCVPDGMGHMLQVCNLKG